ncbi:MAG TPA: hypothetical protein VN894_00910 [Polyangiaceae bacterium]|nr:hypothetical protein [Polyangiaceae bacterium]
MPRRYAKGSSVRRHAPSHSLLAVVDVEWWLRGKAIAQRGRRAIVGARP